MKNNAILILFFVLFNIIEIFPALTPTPEYGNTHSVGVTSAWVSKRPPSKIFLITSISNVHLSGMDQRPCWVLYCLNSNSNECKKFQKVTTEKIPSGLYQIRWQENGRDKADWFTIKQQHLGGFVLRFVQIDGSWRVKIEVATKQSENTFDWNI